MTKKLFADMQSTPANHFNLYFYAAVLHVIQQVSELLGSFEVAVNQFPFLAGYNRELTGHGLRGVPWDEAVSRWGNALRTWEATASCHLPLRALGERTALDHATVTMLLTIGLVEEDSRFGYLFEHFHGIAGQHRPTLGLLSSWFAGAFTAGNAAESLRRLQELGLVQAREPDVPRSSRTLQVPALLWDALRGERVERLAAWVRHRPEDQLARFHELILPDQIQQQAKAVPALLASGEVRALILRGPQHNGRRTLLSAIAGMLGRSVLEINGLSKPDDERWSLVGPLATVLHAMPVVVLELAPGETVELPSLEGLDGPVGLVLGKQGGVSGPPIERALTLTVNMPDANARQRHWLEALGSTDIEAVDAITERFRITSGNLRRIARGAASQAALEGRATVTLGDVQQASRTLKRQTLDALARRVDTCGDWGHLAVAPQTLVELHNLESRCRHRERLQSWMNPALNMNFNAGVRALLCGPSGTGKTLAAQLLASRLQMDLYRLDLSTVVNKYIGETEKNLSQVFARAEELDVILLLDEGDALLTQRTKVQTSNDRYANLETNYLLQRLESFEGILIVTTNAVDRIDTAFQRRMDVVVDFRPPEAEERWMLWQMHLPAEHEVDAPSLTEVASRCVLTGGQIRNAALHASLLALGNGGRVKSSDLEAAVQREYRKIGAVCPLRRNSTPALSVVR
jgi:ATPase family associated with various cellular activities (AAA)